MKTMTRRSAIIIERVSGNWKYWHGAEDDRDGWHKCMVTERPYSVDVVSPREDGLRLTIKMYARSEEVFMDNIYKMYGQSFMNENKFGKIKRIHKL